MTNELFLYGEIGAEGMTGPDVKAVLAQMNQDEALTVRIDSPGGSVFEGFSIYNALKEYPGPKRCIVESAAFSIASYIAMAFDDIEIAENGYLMIHNPMVSSTGDDEQHQKNAELLAKLKESMIQAYSERTGKAESEIRQLMKDESYFNATEAEQNGFVSQVSSHAVASRIPESRKQFLPFRVAASLFGDHQTGDIPQPMELPMAKEVETVAASVSEIQAAFPKMDDSFILNCIKQEMPLASVASAAAEELLKENEALKAQIAAMEEEQAEAAAKAEAESVAQETEEEEEEMAKARARGNAPVANASTAVASTFHDQWQTAIANELPTARNRAEAVKAANRKHPGLRQEMLKEINS